MQIETNAQAVLQRLLQIIATTSDPVERTSLILQAARHATGAAGACLALFGELAECVTDGDIECDPEQMETVAANLSPGFQPNPALSDGSSLYPADYLMAPLHLPGEDDISGAACLVFADTLGQIGDDTALPLLLDAITIVAMSLQEKDRRENAEQLAASLLGSITDPLFVVDENKEVILLNPAAEKVFETDADHACGQFLGDVVQSEELMALVGDPNKKQAEWISADGEKTFVPRTEPVRNPRGGIDGWVLSLRDVTPFKKLARNQNEFTRIVSHDLRSPLTSMQGFANMLELQLVGDLNEKQAHFVEKILSGITQMTALVDNIQDAGRYDPETGFYEINRSHCDLKEVVKRVVDNHQFAAESQELKLIWQVADNIPIISADVHMLERAITNLVDNAIKYTPGGGSIAVKGENDGEQIIISVADTGYGISPENQKHLFERHVRIARKEHKLVRGSGLGLFIVRSVAQRHGGDAWVKSVEGEGSTFFISIPLSGLNLIGSRSE